MLKLFMVPAFPLNYFNKVNLFLIVLMFELLAFLMFHFGLWVIVMTHYSLSFYKPKNRS